MPAPPWPPPKRCDDKLMYRILAIDGGVVRGMVSAMVLAEIERRAGKRIGEMFDLIAGTSSGAILALGLAVPGPDGKPAKSATDWADVFEKEGARIFSRSSFTPVRWIQTAWRWVWAWRRPMYSAKPLEEMLDEQFGETRSGDAVTDVLVVSYATERPDLRPPGSEEPKPGPGVHVASRTKARADKRKNFKMKDIARGSSAGPTFFSAHRVALVGQPDKHYALIDGGVVANNPAMCAFSHARKLRKKLDEILLVSVGAGSHLHTRRYRQVRKWGRIQWLRPILNVLIGGTGETVDFHLEKILPKERYFRFQERLHEPGEGHPKLPSADFDNVSPENIEALKKFARTRIIVPRGR